ncbi:1,6-anhydro-N-acetylmuramyl-L-alanine amidase AmpD [Vibrio sp. JC009]|uniref:1,6-anhydro-N-acetylmuramyl-L-alanine amidase AmpD n=1 Tax=Vibrio sp. JC009 TaxID=2912314 RepID=UPI0023AF6FE9|nr:1,6-anhydro-N-acetylmuramyl-L-alanine amidase AmpD [Vibrio sp. JC009]WED22358.1 1,6-anhydro-N-acetylmuramyl-L-alanine amidase AmpD [Vibrio sp. JC009]
MNITEDYWIDSAKRVPSTHCDERDEGGQISLLVIHNISLPPNQYGGDAIEKFFTGKLDPEEHPYFKVIHTMRVSAHCLIKRTGEIVQFVPFDKRAWHAGKSSFAGVGRCNDYSIGIELEGNDFDGYTEEQYQALSEVTLQLMKTFPLITEDRITGHQYIAPQRKTDPGLSFNWRHYRKRLG